MRAGQPTGHGITLHVWTTTPAGAHLPLGEHTDAKLPGSHCPCPVRDDCTDGSAAAP